MTEPGRLILTWKYKVYVTLEKGEMYKKNLFICLKIMYQKVEEAEVGPKTEIDQVLLTINALEKAMLIGVICPDRK